MDIHNGRGDPGGGKRVNLKRQSNDSVESQ